MDIPQTTTAFLALLLAVGCGHDLTVDSQLQEAQRERCLAICVVRAHGGTLTPADMESMPICDRKVGKCK